MLFWYFVEGKFSHRQKYKPFFKPDLYCSLVFHRSIKFNFFFLIFWVFEILRECRSGGRKKKKYLLESKNNEHSTILFSAVFHRCISVLFHQFVRSVDYLLKNYFFSWPTEFCKQIHLKFYEFVLLFINFN